MKYQIPNDVKNKRFSRLVELQNEISLKKNRALLDKVVRVLCDGLSKNDQTMIEGRTEQDKIVIFKGRQELAGKFINVRITRADTFNLFGEII